GNFDEKTAIGFQSECPVETTIENPTICITNECIEDYNDDIDSRRVSISNGDNDVIYNALVGNYVSAGTITSLNGASPYLSDRMLIAIINSSYFNETQKRNYCTNNAPLNFSVTDEASTHLTTTSMVVINAVDGPSPRNILENEIAFLERDKWISIIGFIAANFTTAGYDDIEDLINAQTEPIAKKVLLQVQLGMGKYAEARDLIHYISDVTEDYKKLQWLYLNIISLRNYVPTTDENTLLDDLEDRLTQDASLARSIRTMLTGQDYYPQLPAGGEDAMINKPDNYANQNIKYATIQPNPANNEVLISQINTKEQNSELMYQINNINGNEFASGKFTDSIPIDMSSWPQGIYFIKINNKNGMQLIKLIKL
ncbi:MAG TPA: T9SS type A sorting domain-containing protein, partial [Saprospiraceae bacterium]|nr:T9SS type A sorting domain-containing protein [Saprospiraceae bacterium]